MSETTLIFDQRAFQRAAAACLLDEGRVSVGHVRRRRTLHGQELLIDAWTRHDKLPSGRDFPPLHDFAILTANSNGRTPSVRLPKLIAPKPSHRLIGTALEPSDRAALPVVVWNRGRVIRPASVRFIGPRLLTLPQLDVQNTTDDQSLRASRTRGALRETFDRHSTLSVLLIGAGRGASELARQLVAAGVRRMAVLDHDRLGPENLDAMPHATPEDIGCPKAVVLAESLSRNQPDLSVSCLTESATGSAGLRFLEQTRADTVFSFVDSDAARLAVSWKCREALMVHLDVGTLVRHDEAGNRQMQADIRLFEPRRGCVACVPAMSPAALDDALYEVSAPDGSLHRGREARWDAQRSGSLLHLNSLACSLAVETWLAYLAGAVRTSHWVRMRWPAGDLPVINGAAVQAADDCRFCHEPLTLSRALPMPRQARNVPAGDSM